MTVVSRKCKTVELIIRRDHYKLCCWEGVFDLLLANQSRLSYLHFGWESEEDENHQKPDSTDNRQQQTLLRTVSSPIIEDRNFVRATIQTLESPPSKPTQRIRWSLLRGSNKGCLSLGLGLGKFLHCRILFGDSIVEGIEVRKRLLVRESGSLRREPLKGALNFEGSS